MPNRSSDIRTAVPRSGARLELVVSAELAAMNDANELINEGVAPEELLSDAYEPDETLINALGRRWILGASGAPDDAEEHWATHAVPWLDRYNRSYRTRCHQRVISNIQEEVCACALERGKAPTLRNQAKLDELCVALARAEAALVDYIASRTAVPKRVDG